jgi:hypothetical protein
MLVLACSKNLACALKSKKSIYIVARDVEFFAGEVTLHFPCASDQPPSGWTCLGLRKLGDVLGLPVEVQCVDCLGILR